MKKGSTTVFGTVFLLAAMAISTLGQSRGLNLANIDNSVDACDNFHQYANGEWLKKTEIPPAYASWGAGRILVERNNDVLKKILEDSAKQTNAPKNSDAQLVGDFYGSCIDEAAIETAGAKPIAGDLKQIGAMKDAKGDLPSILGSMHRAGTSAVFAYEAFADFKDSSMNRAYVWQSGLSLPNSDYYTKSDEGSQKTRDQYLQHVTRMFQLLGDAPDTAKANADSVMKIEMRLARSSKSPVELRDLGANYNKKTFADMAAWMPNFDWAKYKKVLGAPAVAEVIVGQPEFLKTVNEMIRDVPVGDWKAYLRWNVVHAAAPYLANNFSEENFSFFGRTLSGAKEQQPRWKRCSAWTDAQLGEALGQEFVKANFTPAAKARMNSLIDNLFAAYKERIQGLAWMGDATRQQALTKLNAIRRKVGYPDVLRGYKGLTLDRKSFAENMNRAAQFNTLRNMQDMDKPVDKTRWGMTAATVNASYSPLNNEITFPAGILQPPFFDNDADDAVNYGRIGAIIGHEISHGFDDQGSQFDAAGNLKMWWTPDDRKGFEERASCIVDQYNGYEVDKGLFINGKLTLGENIADFAGLIIAYNAFQKSLAGKPAMEKVGSFTNEQAFFVAFGQAWMSKARPEAVRQQVLSDPHSKANWRANGTLSNMPEFASAFKCKAGDKMVREKMCKVW